MHVSIYVVPSTVFCWDLLLIILLLLMIGISCIPYFLIFATQRFGLAIFRTCNRIRISCNVYRGLSYLLSSIRDDSFARVDLSRTLFTLGLLLHNSLIFKAPIFFNRDKILLVLLITFGIIRPLIPRNFINSIIN
jgi:hypothetical protein